MRSSDLRPSATERPSEGAGFDESELVRRLRCGCADAFREVVRAQTRPLLAVARRLVVNEEDARDVVQDAFAAAHRGISSFAGEARVSTWLHRIVVNVALMHLRRRRRHPEELFEDEVPPPEPSGTRSDGFSPSDPPPEERLHARRVREAVRRSIDRLPETHRGILLLRDIEGLSTARAAAALRISPTAAKLRLHRARRALRSLLEEEPLAAREATWAARRTTARAREPAFPASASA
jgi:RNA polymerase sigma-70 factor (ECF subfamily)